MTPGVEGMAPKNTTEGEPAAAQEAVAFQGLNGIPTAAGLEPAVTAEPRADEPGVGPYQQNSRALKHWRAVAKAGGGPQPRRFGGHRRPPCGPRPQHPERRRPCSAEIPLAPTV